MIVTSRPGAIEGVGGQVKVLSSRCRLPFGDPSPLCHRLFTAKADLKRYIAYVEKELGLTVGCLGVDMVPVEIKLERQKVPETEEIRSNGFIIQAGDITKGIDVCARTVSS